MQPALKGWKKYASPFLTRPLRSCHLDLMRLGIRMYRNLRFFMPLRFKLWPTGVLLSYSDAMVLPSSLWNCRIMWSAETDTFQGKVSQCRTCGMSAETSSTVVLSRVNWDTCIWISMPGMENSLAVRTSLSKVARDCLTRSTSFRYAVHCLDTPWWTEE